MFQWFASHRKKEDTEKVSPNETKEKFTTQTNMLRQHGLIEPGLCNQLTNAFIASDIAKEAPNTLINDGRLFYQRAIEQAGIQRKMLDEGNPNFRYPAFESTKTAYSIEKASRSQVTDPDNISKLCGNSKYTMFSVPTEHHTSHMVGLIKEGDTCRFFDADFPGGLVTEDCKKVHSFMAKIIARTYPEKENMDASIAKSR
ncbi:MULTISPECIES: hypothetical protein [unclassified Legionella]|uniref:hypothetical protein n=1 Tax=unclassified Legionella TaxID=2622702 RepID=UPI0010568251|nr:MULTISPECIES: hypothetical protein [unclassified Legionella]MDI9818794.1 hypothetical protein [Legionella sp. PL877]